MINLKKKKILKLNQARYFQIVKDVSNFCRSQSTSFKNGSKPLPPSVQGCFAAEGRAKQLFTLGEKFQPCTFGTRPFFAFSSRVKIYSLTQKKSFVSTRSSFSPSAKSLYFSPRVAKQIVGSPIQAFSVRQSQQVTSLPKVLTERSSFLPCTYGSRRSTLYLRCEASAYKAHFSLRLAASFRPKGQSFDLAPKLQARGDGAILFAGHLQSTVRTYAKKLISRQSRGQVFLTSNALSSVFSSFYAQNRVKTRPNFAFLWGNKNSNPIFCCNRNPLSAKKWKGRTIITFRPFHFSKSCMRSKKDESQTEFFLKTAKNSFARKSSVLGWKKSVATIYYLLIAYKKTLRIKFQYYFNNLTLLQFGVALSPFIAYLIQISLEKYELKYQKNTFLQKSLPGFVKPIPKITWDTFAYTKYSTKFDISLINQVTSVDDCFFISLNPNWQLKQKQFFTGTFEVNISPSHSADGKSSQAALKKWSFLPSRYFYQLLSEREKLNWNSCSDVKSTKGLLYAGGKTKSPSFSNIDIVERSSLVPEKKFNSETNKPKLSLPTSPGFSAADKRSKYILFQNLTFDNLNTFWFQRKFTDQIKNPFTKFSLQKVMERNLRWQIFYNDLDDIPTKVNSLFPNNASFFKNETFSVTPPLCPTAFTQRGKVFDTLALKTQNHLNFTNSLFSSNKDESSSLKSWIQNTQTPSFQNLNHWAPFIKSLPASQKITFTDFCTLERLPEAQTSLLAGLGLEQALLSDVKGYSREPSFVGPGEKTEQSKVFGFQFYLTKGEGQKVLGVQKSNKSESLKRKNSSLFSTRFIKQKLLLKPNRITKDKSLLKTDWIGILCTESYKSTNLGLALQADKTWIEFLSETLNKEILKGKHPLFFERNFQYNIFFGFSKFSKILQLYSVPFSKSVAFKPSEEFYTSFRNKLQNDLTIPLTLLKNEVDPFLIPQALPLLSGTQTFPVTSTMQNKNEKGKTWEQAEVQTFPFSIDDANQLLPEDTKRLYSGQREKAGSKGATKVRINHSSNQEPTTRSQQTLPLLGTGNSRSQSKIEPSVNSFKVDPYHENLETKILQEEQVPFLIQFSSFEKVLARVDKVLARVEKAPNLKNSPNYSFANQTQIALNNPDSLLAFLKKPGDPMSGCHFIPTENSPKIYNVSSKPWDQWKNINLGFVNISLPGFTNLKPFFLSNTGETNKVKMDDLYSFPLKTSDKSGHLAQTEQFLNPLLQRKLSGYLYPDTCREIILTNPGLFNVNYLNPKKNLKISPSLFNSYNEKFSTILLPRLPLFFQQFKSEKINNLFNYSLIQIDQPLSQNLLASKLGFAADNEKESMLLFSNFQKKTDPLNSIEPDKSFTAKKESFFGMPIRSPSGVKLAEYRSQYRKHLAKKDIQKHFLARYDDSLNFLIQSNSMLFKDKGDPEVSSETSSTLAPSFNVQTNLFELNTEVLNTVPAGAQNHRLTKQEILTEITKASTFSNVVLEKSLTFSPFNPPSFLTKFLPLGISKSQKAYEPKNSLRSFFAEDKHWCTFQKKENFFDLEQQPIAYQTPFQYTKSRNVRLFSPWAASLSKMKSFNLVGSALQGNNFFALAKNNWNFSSQSQSEVLSERQTKQNQKLKIANKSRVLNVLYQQPKNAFKTWSILSQLGFVFIVAKLTQILQKEYIEEFLYYIAEFYAFLNEYDKSNLQIFLQGDNYRVIKNSQKKFSDLVGGRFLLTEFGDAILLLRNSRKSFYKIQIRKPQLVTFICLEKFYTKLLSIKSTFFFSEKSKIVAVGQQEQPEIFQIKESYRPLSKVQKKPLAQNIKKLLAVLRNGKTFHLMQEVKSANMLPFFVKGPISELQAQFNEKKNRQEAFVENAGFKFENLIPKGILLVGPPGCGKTLFVQALAGEASVPVIVESGQMLNTNIETNGTERLQDLFKAAREMSPCILFFDEIDTIGQKREKVLSSFTTNEKDNKIPNTLNRIYLQNGLLEKQKDSALLPTDNFKWSVLNPVLQLKLTKHSAFNNKGLQTEITNQKISSEKQQNQNLVILTQLLCELDGLTQKQEIIVIGATNRPSTLDPALTRPGRFGKVIYLGLPGKQKRFELLKFYSFLPSGPSSTSSVSPPSFPSFSHFGLLFRFFPTFSNQLKQHESSKLGLEKTVLLNKSEQKSPFFQFSTQTKTKEENCVGVANKSHVSISQKLKNKGDQSLTKIGVDENINWNYFANQTVGLSSAHISAAINRSALKAIFISISNQQKKRPFSFNWGLKKSFSPQAKPPFSEGKRFSVFDKSTSQNFLVKTFPLRIFDATAGQKIKVFGKQMKIPKEMKLRILVQSGLESNVILNQLIFLYKGALLSGEKSVIKNSPTLGSSLDLQLHNQTVPNYKKQPLHTFETIEYGIQTIATMNSGYQSHLTKGKEANIKILGQLLGEDCFCILQNENAQKQFVSKKTVVTPFFLNLPFVSNLVTKFVSTGNLGRGSQPTVSEPFFPKTKKLVPGQKPSERAFPLVSQVQKTSKNYEPLVQAPILDQQFQADLKRSITSKSQRKSSSKTIQPKGSSKRTVFYQKHRQYFRTLALLAGQSEILSLLVHQPVKTQLVKSLLIQIIGRISLVNRFSDAKPTKSDICTKGKSNKKLIVKLAQIKNLFLIALTFCELNTLQQYINRIIKNHSFGFIFLFNSTCLIKNSLLVFSIQNQNHKNCNFIYYDLIFFKASNRKKTCHILLQWQHLNYLSQSQLFGDSLFINRSAYYLSGKSLITASNRTDKNIDQPIHLWSFVGSVQKRQKKNCEFKALLTKRQFEQFLVSLIAGKAGETLMLSAHFESQNQNTSTIGIEELKEFGSVSKLMLENYLFYSQKELTRKQININLVDNPQQINQQEELLFLKELATLFELQNNNSSSLQKDSLKPYDQFKSFDQPWWQLKAIPLVVSLNLNYKKWYRLFVYEEQQNLRNIEWVAPDKTFHTQVNVSRSVFSGAMGLSSIKGIDKYFVNRELVLKYIEFCKLNWNQLQLLESDSLSSYFLFEAFNKVFTLLEKNLEFIDFLVYSLLCQETLHAFAISNSQQRFSRISVSSPK